MLNTLLIENPEHKLFCLSVQLFVLSLFLLFIRQVLHLILLSSLSSLSLILFMPLWNVLGLELVSLLLVFQVIEMLVGGLMELYSPCQQVGLGGREIGLNELLVLFEVFYFAIDFIDKFVRVLLEQSQLIQSDVADKFQYMVIILH